MSVTSSTRCPFCQNESSPVFSKDSIPILECSCCRHRFACTASEVDERVAAEFDDAYFFGGQSCYDDYSTMANNLNRKGVWYSKLLKRNLSANSKPGKSGESPMRILDVGCAAGYLLQGFIAQGWHGTGIEANLSMAKYGKEQLGLDVQHTTVENFHSSTKYDAVTMVQVISHLIDPVRSIDSIYQRLNDDGLLLIETWNCRSLTAKALKQRWHQYNPPSVLHWFSRASLSDLLDQHGFKVIQQGRPVKWISMGNGAAMFRKMMGNTTLMKVLSSPTMLVPSWLKVPYFLDDVFWVLAKKRTS